jgi:uncharacterized integral membrane protein
MRQFYFTVGLILGLGVAVFAMQNTTAVEVWFLAWNANGPLALVVLASAAAGILMALLFCLPAMLRGRWRVRSLERRLESGPGANVTDGPSKRSEGGKVER